MGVVLPFRPNKLVFPGGIPRLNPAHPASQRCVLAAAAVPGNFSAGAGASNFINLVNGAMGSQSGATGLSGPVVATLGPTILNANAASTTTDATTFTGSYSSAGNGITMAGMFSVKAAFTTSSQYIMTDDGVNATNSIGTGLFGGYSTLQIFINATAYDTGMPINAGSGPFGVPYFAAISACNQGVDPILGVLVNLATGQTFTYKSAPSPGPSLGGGTIYIGNRASTRNWNGWIGTVSYSNVFLTMPQLLQWAQDPWSLWYTSMDLSDMFKPSPADILMAQAML